MDSGTINGIFTAVLLVIFIGIWIWAFSAKRRKDFDQAAQIPLEDNSENTL